MEDTERTFLDQFLRVQDQSYGYIASVLPQRILTEDAFQETNLLLREKKQQFDLDREFAPWAYGIARNVIRNCLLKKGQ